MNMNRFNYSISFLMTLSLVFGVGSDAMVYPADVRAISISGAGVAGSGSPQINPAILISEPAPHSMVFSSNQWYNNILGLNIRYFEKKKYPLMVSVSNWDSGDVDQYGEIPSDDPIGKVSLHWATISVGSAMDFNGWRTGGVLKAHFGRMIIESVTGYTLDFGVQKTFSESVQLGCSILNVGIINSSSLDIALPVIFSGGVQYTEPFFKSKILLDVQVNDEHGTSIHTGVIKSFKKFTVMAGAERSDTKNQFSMGFETQFNKWGLGAGVAFHENSILGTPRYIEISRHF